MSKHMQLTVSVRQHYSGDLESVYPNLARHLANLDPELPAKNPSLYELADQLDKILYRYEGTQLRKVLLAHRDDLRRMHKEIGKYIADWKLAEADRLLYKMEDAFDEIEWKLK